MGTLFTSGISAGTWVRRLGAAAAASLLAGTVALVAGAQPASADESVGSIERSSWAYVDSDNPNTSYFKPSGDLPLGKVRAGDGKNHVYRDYASFDISRYFSPVQISSVQLVGIETRVPNCVDRSVEVFATAPFGPSTTWRHRPAEGQKVASVTYKAASSPCPVPYGAIDVTTAVKQAAAAGQKNVSFELREADEHNADLGRWFSNGFELVFHYDTPPDTPTPVSLDNLSCTATAPYPWVNSSVDALPHVYARVSDPDSYDGMVNLTLAVWPVSDPDSRITTPPLPTPNGQVAVLGVPEGALADGGTYAWAVQVTDDEGLSSAWSAPCYVQVDLTPPANAPTVSSTDYPEHGGGSYGGQGIPGSFTFSANGVPDVVGFSYGWGGVPQGGYVAADQPGGTATVSLTPPGTANDLSVYSIDRAGNTSPTTTYLFLAAPTEPIVTTSGQPKIGGSVTLDLQPGVHLPGYEVVSYSVSVNGGPAKTVAAGADGSATTSVVLGDQEGFETIAVTSTSANGWVSTVAETQVYADNSPTVSSPDFPENGTGGKVGQPGSFSFASNLPGSTEFYYSFDWGSTWQSVPVGADGTATISWTPDTTSTFLAVYSQTADGTQSEQYWYGVNVNG